MLSIFSLLKASHRELEKQLLLFMSDLILPFAITSLHVCWSGVSDDHLSAL